MWKPVAAPLVPQAREQHACSHGPVPVHATTLPAIKQLPMPLTVTSWQMPFGLVPLFTHLPLQHWSFWKHTSPFCEQKETVAEQMPLLQKPEQH